MQKARFIYMVDVIDMMLDPEGHVEKDEKGEDKEPDIIATIHLCAGDIPDAVNRTFGVLQKEGVAQPNRRYHVNATLIGPLPQTGGNIIVPNSGEAKAILTGRAGEIKQIPPR